MNDFMCETSVVRFKLDLNETKLYRYVNHEMSNFDYFFSSFRYF